MELCVRDLNVHFGTRCVSRVDGFELGGGQCLGIVGESGAGKSMLAMALLGLAPRLGATVTGSVAINGAEMVGAPERVLRSIRGRVISAIFQSPTSAFNPVLRLKTTFERTMKLHGIRPEKARTERVLEAMRGVRLKEDLLDRYPHQMSGGQLQRMAIALALCLRAELLIADEPTSALDVTVQAGIIKLLEQLKQSTGLSIVLISHDLAVVAQLADRIIVMQDGSVVESAETGQVIDAPSSEYTRDLLRAIPALLR